MGFCNLGAFIVVIWPSSFSGHRFKLESEKLCKLQRENTCYVFSKKPSEVLFFLILFSAGIYLFKVWLKGSQNGYIFFLFIFSSGIYLFKLIKTKSSFSKASILTNKDRLVLFFSESCILLAKVTITCQSKEKTTN